MRYSRFICYDKGEDWNLVVNEDEVKNIKLLQGSFWTVFPTGQSPRLTSLGIKTPGGKDRWCQGR